jgi:peptidyl-prolyl cis-trans isomerase SurA
MDRRVLAIVGLVAIGCASRTCKVRETAMPAAKDVLADPPALVPAMPMAATGPTRGQQPESPQQPAPPVQPVAGTLPPPNGQVAVRIRAHVNGAPILDEELREAMVLRSGELLNAPEIRRAALFQEMAGKELDRLVERELILQDMFQKIKDMKKPQLMEQLKIAANKESDKRLKEIKTASKITGDAEFKAFLQQSGLSADGLRRQTERSFMMTEYIRNIIYPVVERINVQQVREFYEEHPDQFVLPDRVKWLDIFVDASRFASPAAARQHCEIIIQRARAGENFADLAKQFDHGDSSLRNGEGLGSKRGEIKPSIAEEPLFALKTGEIGPIIDMGFGFHIVKVTERDYAGVEPFDEKCQSKIRDKLRNQIAEREYKRLVDELKKKSTVVIYRDQ